MKYQVYRLHFTIKDSVADIIMLILRFFPEDLFYRTTLNRCFLKMKLMT